MRQLQAIKRARERASRQRGSPSQKDKGQQSPKPTIIYITEERTLKALDIRDGSAWAQGAVIAIEVEAFNIKFKGKP